MTVAQASYVYQRAVQQARQHEGHCQGSWCGRCCTPAYLRVDAASIALDLAVAEAHPAEPPIGLVP